MKTAPNKAPLIVLLFCLVVLPLAAQTGKFYSTNNELSSSLINQIFQDKRGFIWIATEYGLNRFDGLRFSNYKHVSGDSTSIKNNYVRTLFEDSRQNLLVGCIDGLMKYDSETDTFREIPMIRAGKRVFPHITQMQKLHNGEIWVVTTVQGIFQRVGKQHTQVAVRQRQHQRDGGMHPEVDAAVLRAGCKGRENEVCGLIFTVDVHLAGFDLCAHAVDVLLRGFGTAIFDAGGNVL